MAITSLKMGMSGTIKEIVGMDDLSLRLQEIGFVPGSQINVISKAPFGGPLAIQVKGSTIALRRNEADRILVA